MNVATSLVSFACNFYFDIFCLFVPSSFSQNTSGYWKFCHSEMLFTRNVLDYFIVNVSRKSSPFLLTRTNSGTKVCQQQRRLKCRVFFINLALVLFLQPSPKYFHSTAIIDDLMVVYGGRSNTSDQFFSRQLWFYNVKCNYWHLFSGIIYRLSCFKTL